LNAIESGQSPDARELKTTPKPWASLRAHAADLSERLHMKALRMRFCIQYEFPKSANIFYWSWKLRYLEMTNQDTDVALKDKSALSNSIYYTAVTQLSGLSKTSLPGQLQE
jgi:hypothetical protein